MITDFVPGSTLNVVSPTVNEEHPASIKEQLAHQLKHSRSCTNETLDVSIAQRCLQSTPRFRDKAHGRFGSEAAFDEWYFSREKSASARHKWESSLAELQRRVHQTCSHV